MVLSLLNKFRVSQKESRVNPCLKKIAFSCAIEDFSVILHKFYIMSVI